MKKHPRMTAAERGEKQYRGIECKRNPAHGTKRYTSSGQCVQCCSESAKARVAAIRSTLKAAVSA